MNKNTIFICMPIFHNKRKKLHFGTIINVGELINKDTIRYTTKNGVITEKISELGSPIVLKTIDEIDYENSLYYWRKKHNNYKPIVLDESIELGETYFGICWHFKLLIQDTKDKVLVKPILD